MQPLDERTGSSSDRPSSPASVVFVTRDRRQSTDARISRNPSQSPSILSTSPRDNDDRDFGSDGVGLASPPAPREPVEDLTVDQWLDLYSRGALGGNEGAPKPPRAIAEILRAESQRDHVASTSEPETETEMFIYTASSSGSHPSVDSSTPSTSAALDFFAKHGHLVAPKLPNEAARLKLTRKYGLDRPRRRAAIDSICRLAQRSFKMPTVVISLTFEDDQVLSGEVGFGPQEPGPDDPPRRLGLEPAFCTHALVAATDPGKTFIVPNAKEDWRFRKSPYVDTQDGISFYAAANVHLPTDLLEHESHDLPRTLPVGALCLIDSKARGLSEFGPEDRETLQQFAGLIARELILGYEQDQRQLAEAQSNALEGFLHAALILADDTPNQTPPIRSTTLGAPSTPTSPSARRVHASPATAAALEEVDAPVDPSKTLDYAAYQLVELTSATSTAVLDLRSFHHERRGIKRRSGSQMPKSMDARGRVRLLSSQGDVDWTSIVDGDHISDAVSAILTQHDQADSETALKPASQLVAILPGTVQATLALPVHDVNGSPSLLIILTSREKHSIFGSPDIRFARNIGAVVVAYLLRQRATEADRAKLAFVASVSHELRTPLHGINSQVELIREFSTPSQLRRIAPLLDCADVCLESLRDVLDDTLDFAKLSQHASLAETREAHASALVEADLEQIVVEVQKAVWVRKRRVDLVKDDTDLATHKPVQTPDVAKVDLVLEVQDRQGGWKAWADVGGLKRCLLNLVGNALKFTTSGHVKLTLREIPPRPSTNGVHSTVVFEVEDTGCGMDDSFACKAFLPFVQANSFADGAGLGLSIVASIVQRMSGTVEVRSRAGEGTVVTFALPMTFIAPTTPVNTTPVASPTFRRRVISDELAILFSPGSPASLIGSPGPVRTSSMNGRNLGQTAEARVNAAARIDFGHAIEAAHSSPQLLGVPSRRRVAPSMSSASEPSELAVQAAKLSLATTLSTTPESNGMGPGQVQGVNAAVDHDSVPGSPVGPSIDRSVKVLIADDNRIALNILAKLFSAKKIAYEAVENGQEAIDAYKAGAGTFNLVLADVQMPLKDGVEAAYEIREHERAMGWPRCRIVAVTGLSNEVDMRAAGVIDNDGPIDAWIVKGKSLRVLLDEVYRVQHDLEQPASEGGAQQKSQALGPE